MSYQAQIYFLLLFCLMQEAVLGIGTRKMVYQRDMSEHCRRRVMPSVFLGRHVVDAYSQILHFSKMELPYSCFISVRTESGSNIILVAQLISEDSLVTACEESSSQLLVYQLGETFGGYWGHLPDFLMTESPMPPKLYTIKATVPPVKLNKVFEEVETLAETETTTQSSSQDITQDFIEVEIPLVDLTGKIVSGVQENPERAFDADRHLDFLYDVLPRENDSYQTSILPLVQFSMKNSKYERKNFKDGVTVPYKLGYGFDEITQDSRLIYSQDTPTTNEYRQYPKYKPYMNKLQKLRTKRPLLANHGRQSYVKRLRYTSKKHHVTDFTTTKSKNFMKSKPLASEFESWKSVEELMAELTKNINRSTTYDEKFLKDNITSMLQKLEHEKYNGSAYLFRGTHFTEIPLDNNNIGVDLFIRNLSSLLESNQYNQSTTDTILTTSGVQPTFAEKYQKNISTTTSYFTSEVVQANETVTDHKYVESIDEETTVTTELQAVNKDVEFNFTTLSYSANSTYDANISYPTGTLVDHKSWENVVQIAQDMAILLNETTVTYNDTNIYNDTDLKFSSNRKKRTIWAIPIKKAKPHSLTTKSTVATTKASTYHVSDIQEFAQLVELHDDELQDRVSLRHLRRYVGPSLFNICDFTEPKERYVYLFNSSRIVIAISNFTMQRMTIVMTPARTLQNGEVRCKGSHLECQVSGTRVCIDSMSACDGVPNCGAYDIYDEDRLMCGAAIGLQHNVCLAAVTFLAVMLTLLYAVHYWLRRCVPRVSEAFFIYHNGDENILYLDSIMRSPHDMYDAPRACYGNLFEDEMLRTVDTAKQSQGLCNWLTKCLPFKIFKTEKVEEKSVELEMSEEKLHPGKRLYSFAELEIRKIIDKDTVNVSVQTGDSLEMDNQKKQKIRGNKFYDPQLYKADSNERRPPKWQTASVSSDDYQKFADELSILKLFKGVRNESVLFDSKQTPSNLTPDSYNEQRIVEEREIKSHVYDQHKHGFPSHTKSISKDNMPPMISEVPSDVSTRKHAKKNLRFEVETKTIPTLEEYEEDSEENVPGRRKIEVMGAAKDDNQPVPSTSRDFKRFFGAHKGKKTKNTTQMPLR